MKRHQLFEFEDQPWFPRSIRDTITDCIQFGLNLFDFYGPIFARLKDAVLRSGTDRVLDLCSGAGGPWPHLWREFNDDGTRIRMSDKYPNLAAYSRLSRISGGKIVFDDQSVDTRSIPAKINGFRTFFSAFHHFDPLSAISILKSTIDSRQGIAVFEMTGRHPISFLLMFGMPIVAFFCSPFIRPFRISRLFWIYVIPAAPIGAFIDGIISCFRTYSVDEMKALVENLPPNDYRWSIGVERSKFLSIPITYMIGLPPNERI